MKLIIHNYILLGTAIVALTILFIYGTQKMYFHQDDVDTLVEVVNHWPGALFTTQNEHVVLFHRLFVRLEWELFRIYFPGYLFFSFLFHGLNLFLLGVIAKKVTKSSFAALVAVSLVAINSNWNEVIYWMTGQQQLLWTFFSLVSFLYTYTLWQQKKPFAPIQYIYVCILSLLPGVNFGAGMAWPAILFILFGWRWKNKKLSITPIGVTVIFSQIVLSVLYLYLVQNKIETHDSVAHWFNLFGIFRFVLVGVGMSMVARALWPFDQIRTMVIMLILFTGGVILYLRTKPWKLLLQDKIVQSGILITLATYTIYALPRWHFGLWQAMAQRYVYMPMFFLVLALVVVLQKIKLLEHKKIIVFLCISFVILQTAGFFWRVEAWLVRPNQTRVLFEKIDALKPSDCINDDYLPTYINPFPFRRYSDIWPVFKKDWNPFIPSKQCIYVDDSV